MSITISNCEQICGDPSNTSKAKMLYTFSKASRFPKRKIILYDCIYLDVINSMSILHQFLQVEQLLSDMEENTILRKST